MKPRTEHALDGGDFAALAEQVRELLRVNLELMRENIALRQANRELARRNREWINEVALLHGVLAEARLVEGGVKPFLIGALSWLIGFTAGKVLRLAFRRPRPPAPAFVPVLLLTPAPVRFAVAPGWWLVWSVESTVVRGYEVRAEVATLWSPRGLSWQSLPWQLVRNAQMENQVSN